MILTETADGLARVTIDAEHKANTLSASEKAELASVFTELSADEAVRAIVLTGAGRKFFCAGSDIKEMRGLDVAAMRDMLFDERALYIAAVNCTKPIVSAVNGFALGTGFILTLVSDFVVSASSAKFGLPELAIGVATPLEALLLPWFIGLGRTRSLFYTARHLSADEAFQAGLAQEVTSDEDCLATASEYAMKIGAWPADGFAIQKRFLTKLVMTGSLESFVDESLYVAALQYTRPDVRGAIDNFFARK